MIQDNDLKPGQKRLLEVDNPLVVPVDTTIRVLITGTDVIHSWFVPVLRRAGIRDRRPRSTRAG